MSELKLRTFVITPLGALHIFEDPPMRMLQTASVIGIASYDKSAVSVSVYTPRLTEAAVVRFGDWADELLAAGKVWTWSSWKNDGPIPDKTMVSDVETRHLVVDWMWIVLQNAGTGVTSYLHDEP